MPQSFLLISLEIENLAREIKIKVFAPIHFVRLAVDGGMGGRSGYPKNSGRVFRVF